jgi:hypothetical protein
VSRRIPTCSLSNRRASCSSRTGFFSHSPICIYNAATCPVLCSVATCMKTPGLVLTAGLYRGYSSTTPATTALTVRGCSLMKLRLPWSVRRHMHLLEVSILSWSSVMVRLIRRSEVFTGSPDLFDFLNGMMAITTHAMRLSNNCTYLCELRPDLPNPISPQTTPVPTAATHEFGRSCAFP